MFRIAYDNLRGRIHLSLRGQRTEEGRFDWAGAVLDAAIISGITFCTGLGTLASACSVTPVSFCVLLSAVGAEFLGILATKRGLTLKYS